MGWRKKDYIREGPPRENGACNLEEKERKKNKLYSFILELLKEHMILGLDQGV